MRCDCLIRRFLQVNTLRPPSRRMKLFAAIDDTVVNWKAGRQLKKENLLLHEVTKSSLNLEVFLDSAF